MDVPNENRPRFRNLTGMRLDSLDRSGVESVASKNCEFCVSPRPASSFTPQFLQPQVPNNSEVRPPLPSQRWARCVWKHPEWFLHFAENAPQQGRNTVRRPHVFRRSSCVRRCDSRSPWDPANCIESAGRNVSWPDLPKGYIPCRQPWRIRGSVKSAGSPVARSGQGDTISTSVGTGNSVTNTRHYSVHACD